MRYPKCGFDNPEGMKFCGQCTTPLALGRPNCRFVNPPGFKLCGQCTTALTGAPANPKSATLAVTVRDLDNEHTDVTDGERKTVTALFADINGSTELMEELDPEEARAMVDPALKVMIEAVRHYDGYFARSTGDGIFARFGAPAAHETIRSARSTQPCGCRRRRGSIRRNWSPMAGPHSRRGSGSTPARWWWCERCRPPTVTPSTPRLDIRPISLHGCR
jgi:hypothetical protein